MTFWNAGLLGRHPGALTRRIVLFFLAVVAAAAALLVVGGLFLVVHVLPQKPKVSSSGTLRIVGHQIVVASLGQFNHIFFESFDFEHQVGDRPCILQSSISGHGFGRPLRLLGLDVIDQVVDAFGQMAADSGHQLVEIGHTNRLFDQFASNEKVLGEQVRRVVESGQKLDQVVEGRAELGQDQFADGVAEIRQGVAQTGLLLRQVGRGRIQSHFAIEHHLLASGNRQIDAVQRHLQTVKHPLQNGALRRLVDEGKEALFVRQRLFFFLQVADPHMDRPGDVDEQLGIGRRSERRGKQQLQAVLEVRIVFVQVLQVQLDPVVDAFVPRVLWTLRDPKQQDLDQHALACLGRLRLVLKVVHLLVFGHRRRGSGVDRAFQVVQVDKRGVKRFHVGLEVTVSHLEALLETVQRRQHQLEVELRAGQAVRHEYSRHLDQVFPGNGRGVFMQCLVRVVEFFRQNLDEIVLEISHVSHHGNASMVGGVLVSEEQSGRERDDYTTIQRMTIRRLTKWRPDFDILMIQRLFFFLKKKAKNFFLPLTGFT